MSVINGQPANEATFNSAFVSKTANSTVTGSITLNDGDTSQIDNLQTTVNSHEVSIIDHETRLDTLEGGSTELILYASDAAFVAAKGSPATEGDQYGNTTDNNIHYYDGSTWTTIDNNKNNYDAVLDPTINDDSDDFYGKGSMWINTTSNAFFVCTEATVGAAVWLPVGRPFNGTKEIPSGGINGVNVAFNVSSTPVDGTLIVFINGNAVQKAKYTFVNPTITLTFAPKLGQSVEVFYITNGSSSTTQLNAGNEVVHYHTLTPGEITAKQLTLPSTPSVANKTKIDIRSGFSQAYSLDFTVSGDILSWSSLGLEGQIVAGSVLRIVYFS